MYRQLVIIYANTLLLVAVERAFNGELTSAPSESIETAMGIKKINRHV